MKRLQQKEPDFRCHGMSTVLKLHGAAKVCLQKEKGKRKREKEVKRHCDPFWKWNQNDKIRTTTNLVFLLSSRWGTVMTHMQSPTFWDLSQSVNCQEEDKSLFSHPAAPLETQALGDVTGGMADTSPWLVTTHPHVGPTL